MTSDPNVIMLLCIAVLNAITAFLTWRTHQAVLTVEKATNSMKDALVDATGRAEHAAGVEQGRKEEKERDKY